MKSLADLVGDLVKATEEDKIKWKQDSVDTYETSLSGDYSVVVWEWSDPETDERGITAQLMRRHTILDAIRSDHYGVSYSNLQRLYNVARRSANNIDEAIDVISGLLKSLKPARDG